MSQSNNHVSKEDRERRNRMIVRLGKEKMRPYQIVQRVPGATSAIVSSVLFHARLAGEIGVGIRGGYRRKKGDAVSVNVPPDIVMMLQPAARIRKMEVGNLAKHILIAVADSRLVDAILDDGVSTP